MIGYTGFFFFNFAPTCLILLCQNAHLPRSVISDCYQNFRQRLCGYRACLLHKLKVVNDEPNQ